ncbi:head-tail connector protein [Xanthobacter sp. TB0139]|uniref:head-tail connector protein n=1 Tax=Xanthobacter sp. TB0139 TaxID=3459178 RepID=UPI0040396FDA
MAELLVGPAAEPLTRAEAKDFLRLDHDDEDVLVDALITTARSWVESQTGRALMVQSWRFVRDAWPLSHLIIAPLGPVRRIISASVRRADGTVLELPEGALRPGEGALIHVDLAQVPQPVGKGGISISYEAGYGTQVADIPAELVQAVRLLVAHFHEHREGAGDATRLPEAVLALLAPYRLVRL